MIATIKSLLLHPFAELKRIKWPALLVMGIFLLMAAYVLLYHPGQDDRTVIMLLGGILLGIAWAALQSWGPAVWCAVLALGLLPIHTGLSGIALLWAAVLCFVRGVGWALERSIQVLKVSIKKTTEARVREESAPPWAMILVALLPALFVADDVLHDQELSTTALAMVGLSIVLFYAAVSGKDGFVMRLLGGFHAKKD